MTVFPSLRRHCPTAVNSDPVKDVIGAKACVLAFSLSFLAPKETSIQIGQTEIALELPFFLLLFFLFFFFFFFSSFFLIFFPPFFSSSSGWDVINILTKLFASLFLFVRFIWKNIYVV